MWTSPKPRAHSWKSPDQLPPLLTTSFWWDKSVTLAAMIINAGSSAEVRFWSLSRLLLLYSSLLNQTEELRFRGDTAGTVEASCIKNNPLSRVPLGTHLLFYTSGCPRLGTTQDGRRASPGAASGQLCTALAPSGADLILRMSHRAQTLLSPGGDRLHILRSQT